MAKLLLIFSICAAAEETRDQCAARKSGTCTQGDEAALVQKVMVLEQKGEPSATIPAGLMNYILKQLVDDEFDLVRTELKMEKVVADASVDTMKFAVQKA